MHPQHEGHPGQDAAQGHVLARSREYYASATHHDGSNADPARHGYSPRHLGTPRGEAIGAAQRGVNDVNAYTGNPKLTETRERMFDFAQDIAAEFASDMVRKGHQPDTRLITGETTSYVRTPRRILGRFGLHKTVEHHSQDADDVWLIQRTPRYPKTRKTDEHGNAYLVHGEPLIQHALAGQVNVHHAAAYETGIAITRDGRMVAYETIPAKQDLAWHRQGAFFENGRYQTPKGASKDYYVKYTPLTPQSVFPNLLTINPNLPPNNQPGIIAIAAQMNTIEHAADKAAQKAK